MATRTRALTIGPLTLGLLSLACVDRSAGSEAVAEGEGPSSAGESESETAASESSGTETETETDADAESETDTETDTESETETETETETDTDTGNDTGADEGCPDDLITYVIESDYNAWTEAQLAPFEGVECIEGELSISDTVPHLAQLAALERMVGHLRIGDAPCDDRMLCGLPPILTSLEGLENLTRVDGLLTIDSATLLSLAGLEGLTVVDRTLGIHEANLADLDPLAELTEVRWLDVGKFGGEGSSGPSIGQIEALAGLTSVDFVWIVGTSDLTSLAGLENLDAFADVQIINNWDLVDVTPLGAGQPSAARPSVTIWKNPKLPTCNAWALVQALDAEVTAVVQENLPDACGD